MPTGPLPAVNQRVDVWFDGYDEFYGGRVESVVGPYRFHVILDDGSSWNIDSRKHVFKLSDVQEEVDIQGDEVNQSKLQQRTTRNSSRSRKSLSDKQVDLPPGVTVDKDHVRQQLDQEKQTSPTHTTPLRRSKRDRNSNGNSSGNSNLTNSTTPIVARRRSSRINRDKEEEEEKVSPKTKVTTTTTTVADTKANNVVKQNQPSRRSSRLGKGDFTSDAELVSLPINPRRRSVRPAKSSIKEDAVADEKDEDKGKDEEESVTPQTIGEKDGKPVTPVKEKESPKEMQTSKQKSGKQSDHPDNKKDEDDDAMDVDHDQQDDDPMEIVPVSSEPLTNDKPVDEQSKEVEEGSKEISKVANIEEEPRKTPVETNNSDGDVSGDEMKLRKPEKIGVEEKKSPQDGDRDQREASLDSTAAKPGVRKPHQKLAKNLAINDAFKRKQTDTSERDERTDQPNKPETIRKTQIADSAVLDSPSPIRRIRADSAVKERSPIRTVTTSNLEQETSKSTRTDILGSIGKPSPVTAASLQKAAKKIALEEDVRAALQEKDKGEEEAIQHRRFQNRPDKTTTIPEMESVPPLTPPRRRSAGRAFRKSVSKAPVNPAPITASDDELDDDDEITPAPPKVSRPPRQAQIRRSSPSKEATRVPDNSNTGNDSLSTDLQPPVRTPTRQAQRKQRMQEIPMDRYKSSMMARKRKAQEFDEVEDDEFPEFNLSQNPVHSNKRRKKVDVDEGDFGTDERRLSRPTVTFQGTESNPPKPSLSDRLDDRNRPVVERLSPKAITALAVDSALEAAKTVIDPVSQRMQYIAGEINSTYKEVSKCIKKKQASQPQPLKRPVHNGPVIPNAVTTNSLQAFQLDMSEIIGGGEARIKAYTALSEQEFDFLHHLIEQQGAALQELDRLLYAAQAFSDKKKKPESR